MIVINSSPAIILGKQGRLEVLRKCFGEVIIPKSVYDEIANKKESPEIISIEKGIKEKWIVLEKTLIVPELNTRKLGVGEKEAISLSIKHKVPLIIDDDTAKQYATILNVEAHGTLFIVYSAVIKGFIKKSEAAAILNTMIKDGFYVSTEIYARFMELLNSLKSS